MTKKKLIQIQCNYCDRDITENNSRRWCEIDDKYYCEDCYFKLVKKCKKCEEEIFLSTAHYDEYDEHEDYYYCDFCYDEIKGDEEDEK